MKLRIATWNVFLGNFLPIVLNTIKSNKEFKNIDLIALQEASVRNGIEDAKVIASTLGKNYKYYQITAQSIRGLVQANAIIWNSEKIKITKKTSFFLPTHEDVKIGGFERAIKNLLPSERRGGVMIEGQKGLKSFRFYSIHFDVIGFTHKKEQLKNVLQHDKERKPKDLVCVAGDINTFKILKRPLWTALARLSEEFGFLDITTTINWTFSRKLFRFRQKTDAIFLKNTKKLKFSSWSSNIPGSDHIPIFAIIEL